MSSGWEPVDSVANPSPTVALHIMTANRKMISCLDGSVLNVLALHGALHDGMLWAQQTGYEGTNRPSGQRPDRPSEGVGCVLKAKLPFQESSFGGKLAAAAVDAVTTLSSWS